MTDYEALRRDPLAHLNYFTEWGGKPWTRLVRIGLVDYLGGDFNGKRVLEIGARYGRMSCLFGLLGAHVTGIDIHEDHLDRARAEARNLSVESRVEFRSLDGDLDSLTLRDFDIVFVKSVLVLVPDLQRELRAIKAKLKTGGQFVFIENGRGGWLLQLARRLKHRGRWDYSYANYFTENQIDSIRAQFTIERLERSILPPAYLICGTSNR